MNIVFLDAYTNNPGDITFDPISRLGDLTVYERSTLDDLKDRTMEAEIIIVNKFLINEERLAFMPNVKYIIVAATGYNNIDLTAVAKRGIAVSNVRDYSTDAVAQHVFASIFTIFNKLGYYDSEVKKGRWSHSPDFCFYDHSITEVAGLTMGIYGFGTIGQKVAKIGHSMDMKVIAKVRDSDKPKPDYVSFVSDEAIFSQSDIMSFHAPLTSDTKGVVNKQFLKMMKPNAILINTSRGGLVNETDLFYALDHDIIAGAALDVLESEPPHYSNPLINHPKCLVSPHIAWASRRARMKLIDGVALHIHAYKNGQQLITING